ncbi:MAG: hypothetical protein C0518_08830 [Opitutus sp.]|nr:hypothetical protein [Opitutus sp.]
MRPLPFRLTCWVLAASTTTLAANPPSEWPELPELPTWSTTIDASLAGGYRDNLLLSPTRPERSPLLRAEIDVMTLRVPAGAFDGYAYLNLLENRYLSGEITDRERTAIFAGEARWQPSTALKAVWFLQAYHLDQVLDVSVTETELSTAQLRVTGFATGPSARWTLAPFWFEAKVLARRDTYRDDLDGYRDTEGSFAFGRAWGHGSELSAVVTRRLRDHDSRPQVTVAGRPLPGTQLETRQTEGLLQWLQIFDTAKNLRFSAALGRQWSRDNGTGYFDYDRDTARAGLSWKTAPWENEFLAEANRYRFPVQFIGVGINPAIRRKNELRLSWEITHRFTERLAGFLHLEREQSRSNDDRSRFTVHTVYAGVRVSWDSLGAAP